jgi:hypothetical protein
MGFSAKGADFILWDGLDLILDHDKMSWGEQSLKFAMLLPVGKVLKVWNLVKKWVWEVHHFLSNKNFRSGFTEKFKKVTSWYWLNLDDAWNKWVVIGHKWSHPNAYHEYMLKKIQEIDKVAQWSKEVFLKKFQAVKDTITKTPEMLKKSWWTKK